MEYTEWDIHWVEYTEWNTHVVEYTRNGIHMGVGYTRIEIYIKWDTYGVEHIHRE